MSKVALQIESLGIGHRGDLALVHGWGLGKAVWQPVTAALGARYRVHLIELPGYGGPGPAPAAAGFSATAQALPDLLPAGTALCGWSLGSMLALQAALLAPRHFCRLILVGATPCFTRRAGWDCAQPPSLLDAFASAVAAEPRLALQRFVALLNQGDSSARENIRRLTPLAATPPAGTALAQGLAWLREVDLRPALESLQHAGALPTLLIHGRHDALMPLAAGEWLHERLPASRLEIFAAAAHAPFLNDGVRFAELLGDFCHAPAAA
jgi:pimeloyl-[acyl-carrier protein] methyl ester esterase